MGNRTKLVAGGTPQRLGRLRWPDTFTLLAVALVVLLVSLPRLREFALRENQGDASSLVQRLGRLLDNSVQAGPSPTVQDLVQDDALFAEQLGDAEFLDGGRVLRRHGYLFEVVPADAAPSGGPDAGAPPLQEETAAATASAYRVRAWPWEHGRSGLASFVWLPGRGLARHGNAPGQWSGRDRPPAPVFTGPTSPDAAEWRLVED